MKPQGLPFYEGSRGAPPLTQSGAHFLYPTYVCYSNSISLGVWPRMSYEQTLYSLQPHLAGTRVLLLLLCQFLTPTIHGIHAKGRSKCQ